MDRPQGFRPQQVDRTPYRAFSGMAVAVILIFFAASWLLGAGIARARRLHIALPSFSLPKVSTPANVGDQVQGTLQNAADSAVKSAVDSASQAAKDEATKQAKDAQQSLQGSLQDGLK